MLNNEPPRTLDTYLSQENPRINLTTRTQCPQKFNVWDGIFNNYWAILVVNLNTNIFRHFDKCE
jgi:hypothetical protein